jgi:hypothetical protein
VQSKDSERQAASVLRIRGFYIALLQKATLLLKAAAALSKKDREISK